MSEHRDARHNLSSSVTAVNCHAATRNHGMHAFQPRVFGPRGLLARPRLRQQLFYMTIPCCVPLFPVYRFPKAVKERENGVLV